MSELGTPAARRNVATAPGERRGIEAISRDSDMQSMRLNLPPNRKKFPTSAAKSPMKSPGKLPSRNAVTSIGSGKGSGKPGPPKKVPAPSNENQKEEPVSPEILLIMKKASRTPRERVALRIHEIKSNPEEMRELQERVRIIKAERLRLRRKIDIIDRNKREMSGLTPRVVAEKREQIAEKYRNKLVVARTRITLMEKSRSDLAEDYRRKYEEDTARTQMMVMQRRYPHLNVSTYPTPPKSAPGRMGGRGKRHLAEKSGDTALEVGEVSVASLGELSAEMEGKDNRRDDGANEHQSDMDATAVEEGGEPGDGSPNGGRSGEGDDGETNRKDDSATAAVDGQKTATLDENEAA